jgi:hypothetical protein
MITYLTSIKVTRSTPTLPRRDVADIVEAVQGNEEFSTFFELAASAVDVPVSLNNMQKVKALVVDAKPNGGVDNVDVLVKITPTARAGVTAQPMEIPVGSRLVILDTGIAAITVSNLSPIKCFVSVLAIGD